MTIHKEGYKSIIISGFLFALLNFIPSFFIHNETINTSIFLCTLVLFLFIISFFRIPKRVLTLNDNQIIAPADGKVVVIEEVYDEEYFKDKRLQISIFMSPLNVHVNRNPISGEVVYNMYHQGKYLVAWHPKSSTENERWSLVTKHRHGAILYKQIAGALAKRICNYTSVGQFVKQTDEYGFIKFGSRVDLLLPIGTKINVTINQKVQGGVTPIASWGE